MKIYDISQEVFGCKVYPGDPAPRRIVEASIENGDVCNLTSFSMCTHNGTHIDAPFHFVNDGETVDSLPLEVFVGKCFVSEFEGNIGKSDAENIIKKAGDFKDRILIKGKAVVTSGAALAFAENGVLLVGNESQTVGPEDAPMEVHNILLGKGVVLLEGICLKDVPEGKYFLSAAPLNLSGSDGSPCRAVLVEF